MKPKFFSSPARFRSWLEKNHGRRDELIVGYWKVATGRPSMTWSESVDQALCFGWIDGIRRSIDEASYSIRFTPRREGSTWSKVNLDKVKVLKRAGLMMPAGLAVHTARDPKRSQRYSFEQKNIGLDPVLEKTFKRAREAWAFFQEQPPSYRKPAIWWVMSARRLETRERRLAQLIEHSGKRERIPALRRPATERTAR